MRRTLAALALSSFSCLCLADIIVGQTTAMTGGAASGALENLAGARLYIDHVNAEGGILGEKIKLVSLDDKFEPALARDNALKLITEHNAVVLFMTRGTPHTQAVQPLLAQHKVALVAPSTGAMTLHAPIDPWVFNVRAPYQREAEKAVQHLATIGITRIGIAYVNDSFGADSVQGATRGFREVGMQPSFVIGFDRTTPDLKGVAKSALDKDVQAVLLIASSSIVSDGVRALRSAGSHAQVVTLSNNASGGFIKQLGAHARGTIVTQVFPSERAVGVPMVKEAAELARSSKLKLTPAVLEGFAAAKVLVAGLKGAGPKPSRQAVRDAMERLSINIGGMDVAYTANDHSGLTFAEMSIIGPEGKFVR